MKLFSKMTKRLGLGIAGVLATPLAMAGSLNQDDEFYEFFETVTNWASGAFGVGVATTMLLMGGAIGVAKNSPMPALSGIAGAAFLHWGPDAIQRIMVGGLVV